MKYCRWLLLAAVLLLLTGCAAERAELDGFAPDPENRIVIYTSHKPNVYQPIIREFEERTGIWVQVVTGGSYELLEQLDREKDAPAADIMFGGGVDSLNQYLPLFAFCSYPNPEEIAPAFLLPEGYIAPFSALPVVLICNTKLVDAQSITSWADLSRPEFRGQIAFADPEKSSSSFNALAAICQIGGEQAMEALAVALDGKQCGSSASVVTAVAEGSCLIGITLESSALQYIAAGNSLSLIYPEEGTTCITDCTAIVKNAPHPENARRFLEFALSRDVQQYLFTHFFRRSVLKDVLNPNMIPLDQVRLINYDTEWSSSHADELLQQWNDMRKEAAR